MPRLHAAARLLAAALLLSSSAASATCRASRRATLKLIGAVGGVNATAAPLETLLSFVPNRVDTRVQLVDASTGVSHVYLLHCARARFSLPSFYLDVCTARDARRLPRRGRAGQRGRCSVSVVCGWSDATSLKFRAWRHKRRRRSLRPSTATPTRSFLRRRGRPRTRVKRAVERLLVCAPAKCVPVRIPGVARALRSLFTISLS